MRLKQRFPILCEMRSDFQTSQRIVIACCVPHNIAEKFKDELPADVDHLDPYRRPMVDVDLYDLPAEILFEPRSVEVDEAKAKRDKFYFLVIFFDSIMRIPCIFISILY